MKRKYIVTLLLCGALSLQVNAQKADAMTEAIIHTVLFRFSDEATPEQISHLMTSISHLEKKIPGISEVSCGRNFSERSKGFTYAATLKFSNEDALHRFYQHPEHVRLVQQEIKPIISDMLVLDYRDAAQK